MKTIFCLIASVLVSAYCFAQDNDSIGDVRDDLLENTAIPQSSWEQANNAYVNADYAAAIKLYENILAQQTESAVLYYNLGNAYFKSGDIARSILNYNRARRLAPSNEDINYNLSIANTFVQDKIDAVPVFFAKAWIEQVQTSSSSNTWAVLSVVFFALLLVFAGLYLLAQGMRLRKVGFYAGIACMLIFIVTVMFAASQKKHAVHSNEAVVMSSSVSVKSSPDAGSKDIFVLHAGTKVVITGELNGWREIMIADGNKGWLQLSSIEII